MLFSRAQCKIENPRDADKAEEVPAGVNKVRRAIPVAPSKSHPALFLWSQALEGFGKKLMWRRLQRQYGVGDDNDAPPPPEDDEEGGGSRPGGMPEPPGGDEGGGSRYVPPSARGGGAVGGSTSLADRFGEDRDHATLRVTNISEDTTEADLQDLFMPFGRLARIYLAKARATFLLPTPLSPH